MTTAARLLKVLLRLSGIAALLLGLAFWTGHLFSWVPAHILLGFVVVLAMWAIAALAFRAGANRGLAALVALWGFGVVVLGRMQVGLVPGEMHWIIALAHLLAGGAAMGLGAALANAVERSASRIASEASREPPHAAGHT